MLRMALTALNAVNGCRAVARGRSLAAAALELGISPSAPSQAVRQLEARLGVVLLSRTTRSVALTEAGKRLFEQSGPAISHALEALKDASAQTGEVTGKVRLTLAENPRPFVITPGLPRFPARPPRVALQAQAHTPP